MTLYTETFATLFGPFSVAVAEDEAVVGTAFGDRAALKERLNAEPDVALVDDSRRTRAVREQVRAYAAGERTQFTVTLRPVGSEFSRRVWQALTEIPCGETRTYAELAMRVRSAPRAVGQANARNPICLIVPCHRVIGTGGTLTGFAFGTALKRRLLEHERALTGAVAR